MDRKDQISAIIRRTRSLVEKTVEELGDLDQFRDSSRRSELLHRGLDALSAIARRGETSTLVIEELLEHDIEEYHLANGITSFVSDTYPLSAYTFPTGVRIDYHPIPITDDEPPIDKRYVNSMAYITATTVLTNSRGTFPSEGYRGAEGKNYPFKTRKPQDEEQHGGFFVDNHTGELIIYSYRELMDRYNELSQTDMAPATALIQANWYMTSANQDSVCARKNLQDPLMFNAFGYLYQADGTKTLFAINGDPTAVGKQRQITPTVADSITNGQASTMRQVAALCNYLMHQAGAVAWEICGTEFNAGGTFINTRMAKAPHNISYNPPLKRDLLIVEPTSQH